MPYKSDKIKIAGTSYDRRVKLTDNEREEIKYLYKTSVHSQRKLASMFNVSRSLIAMVLNPERLQRARELFKERRKDGRYNVSRKERARIIREPFWIFFLRHEEFADFLFVRRLVAGKGRTALDVFADIEVIH